MNVPSDLVQCADKRCGHRKEEGGQSDEQEIPDHESFSGKISAKPR